MNQLAKEINEESQAIRAIFNFLSEAFAEIKEKDFDDCTIKNEKDFYSIIADASNHLLKVTEEDITEQ
jgi:hypothetical protein